MRTPRTGPTTPNDHAEEQARNVLRQAQSLDQVREILDHSQEHNRLEKLFGIPVDTLKTLTYQAYHATRQLAAAAKITLEGWQRPEPKDVTPQAYHITRIKAPETGITQFLDLIRPALTKEAARALASIERLGNSPTLEAFTERSGTYASRVIDHNVIHPMAWTVAAVTQRQYSEGATINPETAPDLARQALAEAIDPFIESSKPRMKNALARLKILMQGVTQNHLLHRTKETREATLHSLGRELEQVLGQIARAHRTSSEDPWGLYDQAVKLHLKLAKLWELDGAPVFGNPPEEHATAAARHRAQATEAKIGGMVSHSQSTLSHAEKRAKQELRAATSLHQAITSGDITERDLQAILAGNIVELADAGSLTADDLRDPATIKLSECLDARAIRIDIGEPENPIEPLIDMDDAELTELRESPAVARLVDLIKRYKISANTLLPVSREHLLEILENLDEFRAGSNPLENGHIDPRDHLAAKSLISLALTRTSGSSPTGFATSPLTTNLTSNVREWLLRRMRQIPNELKAEQGRWQPHIKALTSLQLDRETMAALGRDTGDLGGNISKIANAPAEERPQVIQQVLAKIERSRADADRLFAGLY